MRKTELLSGRVKKVTGTSLDSTRYEFLDLKNAEPDLGFPTSTVLQQVQVQVQEVGYLLTQLYLDCQSTLAL